MTIDNFPKALVMTVTICSMAYLFTHIYSVYPTHMHDTAFRLNNFTGLMMFCQGNDCWAADHK